MSVMGMLTAGMSINKRLSNPFSAKDSPGTILKRLDEGVAKGEIQRGTTLGGLRDIGKLAKYTAIGIGAVATGGAIVAAAPVIAAGAGKIVTTLGAAKKVADAGAGGFRGTILKPAVNKVVNEVATAAISPVRETAPAVLKAEVPSENPALEAVARRTATKASALFRGIRERKERERMLNVNSEPAMETTSPAPVSVAAAPMATLEAAPTAAEATAGFDIKKYLPYIAVALLIFALLFMRDKK